eukprot:GHVU01070461.1.p1 GENE.GHVU01070461.1~~GHVU01070461.1.p1  ORF type:complete len:160 (-),score=16.72 GHVU01070461.1:72-551(-)
MYPSISKKGGPFEVVSLAHPCSKKCTHTETQVITHPRLYTHTHTQICSCIHAAGHQTARLVGDGLHRTGSPRLTPLYRRILERRSEQASKAALMSLKSRSKSDRSSETLHCNNCSSRSEVAISCSNTSNDNKIVTRTQKEKRTRSSFHREAGAPAMMIN